MADASLPLANVLRAGPLGRHRLAGATFGPYVIVSELGRGGFGVVVRARRRDAPDAPEVALKAMLHGPDAGRAKLRRFQREAQVAMTLRHPGIVPALDAGEHDGVPFIAFELVEGHTLDAALEQASVDRRLELLARISRAVAHAHARGVVHRDLKPGNVLVRARDGLPLVTDFGLARDLNLASSLTKTGAMLGTPAYMAPEQIKGLEPTAATDVYALGEMAYEALTGRLPFPNDNLALRYAAMLGQRFDPASRTPGVPPSIDAVLARALATKAEQRYPDAGALADALDAVRGVSTREDAATSEAPAARPAARPVLRVALAGGALLALALGAGLAVGWPERPAPAATTAPAPGVPTTATAQAAPAAPRGLVVPALAAWSPTPLVALAQLDARPQVLFLGPREALTWDERAHLRRWRFDTGAPALVAERACDLSYGVEPIVLPRVVHAGDALFVRGQGRVERLAPDLTALAAREFDAGPLAVLPEGDLAVPTLEGVRLLDPVTLADRALLPYPSGNPPSGFLVCAAAAEGTIAVGGGDPEVVGGGQLFRVSRGEAPGCERVPATILCAALSGDLVAFGGYSGYLYHARGAGPIERWSGSEARNLTVRTLDCEHGGHVQGLCFSPDGRWLASVASVHPWEPDPALRGRFRELRLWRTSDATHVELVQLPFEPTSVDWSADGELLLIGARGEGARVLVVPTRYRSGPVGSNAIRESSSGR